MNDLLIQIILARRNDDVGSWMQILVFVALAVFWAIGGIIKSKASKFEADDKGNVPRKPLKKPPVHSREAREQMLRRLERPSDAGRGQIQQPRPAGQKPRIKFADFQAAIRKFAAEAEKALDANTQKAVPKSSRPSPAPKPSQPLSVPQITAEKPKLAEPLPAVDILMEDKQTTGPAKLSEPGYLSELLTDYADPDDLRRAILHYEILGKPLSLRDPYSNSIGS